MRIVVAPDSFKGSISAPGAAAALAAGLGRALPWAEIDQVPMADGGEGTVEALVGATGGRLVRCRVTGPLGEPVEAFYGLLGDGQTAVIEMAAASGLPLVPPDRRDPRRTTTYGTGELIRAALDQGCRRLIVGIGGSATNDGGAGMAAALGARFLDEKGQPLPLGGAALRGLARIDLSGLDPRLQQAEVLVACDVDNPLLGPRGASRVYGPQKGATPEMVEELEAALAKLAEVIRRDLGRDVAEVPGAGAAGGLGAGLLAFLPARLRRGVEIVVEAVRLEERIAVADLVVTGEGALDWQTAFGKVPAGVAAVARRHGKPVVAVAGTLGVGVEQLVQVGIDAAFSIVPRPLSLEEAMRDAPALLEAAGERLGRLLAVGARLGAHWGPRQGT